MKNINSTSIRIIENNKMNRTLRNKKIDLIGSVDKTKIRKTKRQTKQKKSIIKEINNVQLDNKIPILKKELTENINLKTEESINNINTPNKELPSLNSNKNNLFTNIKCDYILRFIFDNLSEKRNLKIVRKNKSLQERLEINIKDYKKYKNRIEMNLIPIPIQELKDEKNIFINYDKNEKKSFYHIYFNNSRKESERNYITKTDKVNKIRILLESGIKSIEGLFQDCKCLKRINCIKFKRSDITNMSKMFYGCTSLLFLDISNFITYRVTNMSQMFFDCKALMDLDIINFKTFNVYDMSNMFYGCQSLTDLNLFNFDTSKVRNMYRMFFGCKLLKFLNLSNFDTSSVTNMSHMFFGCQSLNRLNIANFDTFNVTNMSYMFYGCQSLKEINVSNFRTNFVRDLSGMFLWCRSLRNINISNFVFHELSVVNFMFYGCSKELQEKVKSQNKALYLNDKAFEG